MKKYLLDTNICIAVLRKSADMGDIISRIDMSQCYISEITLIELKVGEILGRAKAPQGKFANQHIEDFTSRLTILPISTAIDFFAEEKVRLQLSGTPAHNNFDLLIGCTAVVNDMTMVTDNIKDFKNIRGIKTENWIRR